MEVYIDPIFPAPRLLILGASPVSQALAGLGRAMGYDVLHSVDAVGTDAVGTDAVESAAVKTEATEGHGGRGPGVKLFVVVATMGEADEDFLLEVSGTRPDYLGVVSSRRRMEEVRAELGRRGADAAFVEAIRGPAGLDIGAVGPEEIALSIVAEIVASERQADAGAGGHC